MFGINLYLLLVSGLGLVGLATLFFALLLRRVVPTNEVHIVQSARKTRSFGLNSEHGNTYYEWPSWVPMFGIMKSKLPTSVFDLALNGYEAYDKGRLPFVIDVMAFFRISDSNVAAQRVANFTELHEQLKAIVQGAVRTILASNDIEEIMQGRSKFGEQFTAEVESQLTHWGVVAVKNIELMDIRDSKDSNVIRNIMEKKKSHIEMESRTEVAKNRQVAEGAEIEAKRRVDIQKQEAIQAVGLRTIETNREMELQTQTSLQTVKEQEKLTKQKQMEVLSVEQTKLAEIEREVKIVAAQQQKQTTVLLAEGQLEAAKHAAAATTVSGQAQADAAKALALAPITAQITLAKEIGSNKEYQEYLVTIRQVEAAQAIGIEQAKALEKADIKIISNTDSPTNGLNNVRDLFSSKGGMALGSMIEGLASSEKGKAVVSKLTGTDK